MRADTEHRGARALTRERAFAHLHFHAHSRDDGKVFRQESDNPSTLAGSDDRDRLTRQHLLASVPLNHSDHPAGWSEKAQRTGFGLKDLHFVLLHRQRLLDGIIFPAGHEGFRHGLEPVQGLLGALDQIGLFHHFHFVGFLVAEGQIEQLSGEHALGEQVLVALELGVRLLEPHPRHLQLCSHPVAVHRKFLVGHGAALPAQDGLQFQGGQAHPVAHRLQPIVDRARVGGDNLGD